MKEEIRMNKIALITGFDTSVIAREQVVISCIY